MGLSHSPRIVTDGLVLCVDASNKRSYPGTGTTWYDLGKNKYHGTLVNEPTFVSAEGKSYFQLDGANDRVDFDYLQPAYQTTTDFTWCIWLWYDGSASSGSIIIGNRYNSAGTDDPRVFVKLQPRGFQQYPSTLLYSVLLNQWQQVIIVKNQTNLFYYRNGELQTSMTSSATQSQTAPFSIGSDHTGAEATEMKVNSCHVYDIPFSAEQARQHYLATRHRFGV